jgi:hypothetical protein
MRLPACSCSGHLFPQSALCRYAGKSVRNTSRKEALKGKIAPSLLCLQALNVLREIIYPLLNFALVPLAQIPE